ncbi:MAG: hypothetical protein HYX59_12720 [Elusimicrobia bacterium]|nr:hypothetical protein [Elusimicrobiota bacterium]
MKAAWAAVLLLLAAAAPPAGAAAAPPAGAAVVRLKDGASLEGTVISSDARELVIRTPAGPRRIDAALVRSVEYEAATPAGPTPSPPPAAPPSEPWRSGDKNIASFGFGLAAPLSHVDFHAVGGGHANEGDLGPLLSVRYLRSATSRLAAGLDLEYLHRPATVSPGLLPLADSSVSGDNLLMLAVARWHLIDHGSVRPYLLGGAGASRSWTRIESAPIRGFAWTDTGTDEARRLVDDSVWAFAAAARLGVDFDWEFADPAVIGLEAGWTALESRTYGATRSGRDLGLTSVSSRLNLFTLAARWSWRW